LPDRSNSPAITTVQDEKERDNGGGAEGYTDFPTLAD